MRLRHGYKPSSSSDTTSDGEDPDDCQDFLLSPPHLPLVPSTSKILGKRKASLSPIKLQLPNAKIFENEEKTIYTKTANSNSRICSPPYYVEQCKDLVMVLSKRNSNSMVILLLFKIIFYIGLNNRVF